MGGGTDEFVGREKSAGAEDVTTSVLMRLFFFSLCLCLSRSLSTFEPRIAHSARIGPRSGWLIHAATLEAMSAAWSTVLDKCLRRSAGLAHMCATVVAGTCSVGCVGPVCSLHGITREQMRWVDGGRSSGGGGGTVAPAFISTCRTHSHSTWTRRGQDVDECVAAPVVIESQVEIASTSRP